MVAVYALFQSIKNAQIKRSKTMFAIAKTALKATRFERNGVKAINKAIYNSFMSYYHIDLLTTELHWWQFKTLFDGLGEETELMKIIS